MKSPQQRFDQSTELPLHVPTHSLLVALFGLTPAVALAAETVVVDAAFDGDAEGFDYLDDAFRGTSAPVYADGFHDVSDGVLEVTLGGLDYASVFGMSGGWARSFNLGQDAEVRIEFDYNLTQSAHYESNEFSQVLAAIDGELVGPDGRDDVDQLAGNGNGGAARSTGWQSATIELGTLSAGTHEIVLGGYNNQKTYWNEATLVALDNVRVVAVDGGSGDDGGDDGDGDLPNLEFTVDLLPRPSGWVTVPFDLNESGEAVGYYNDSTLAYRAVYWAADGQAVDLASPGTWSQAHGISDAGQISGYYGPTLQSTEPIIWDGSGMAFLNLPPGFSGGVATDVSSSGRTVGYSFDAAFDPNGMLWQDSSVVSFDDGRSFSEILDSNAAVGRIEVSGERRAAHWGPDGAVTILAGIDGQPSTNAAGISRNGRIVGSGPNASGTTRLLVWDFAGATPIVLDLANGQSGIANDINSFGWVVGADHLDPYNGTGRAFIWDENGTPLELGDLIVDSGWILREAVAVNDSGQILVSAVCTSCGVTGQVAALLTPVP